jgi:hypothetical protein
MHILGKIAILAHMLADIATLLTEASEIVWATSLVTVLLPPLVGAWRWLIANETEWKEWTPDPARA